VRDVAGLNLALRRWQAPRLLGAVSARSRISQTRPCHLSPCQGKGIKIVDRHWRLHVSPQPFAGRAKATKRAQQGAR